MKSKKLRLGLIYGLLAGLAFALFAWGIDALLLARANVTFFWVKFLPALLICVLIGGTVGWLTALFDKHGLAILLWGLLAVLYSWLVVWIPITAYPIIIKILNPSLARWFDFSLIQDLAQFRYVGLVVVGFAAMIAGLLEINLIHQALLSPYLFGTITMMLVSVILFGLAGSGTDQLINRNFREPAQVINNLIQFAVDNQGVDVPKTVAWKMHLSAADQLAGIIQNPRKLTLISYDETLGTMNILVDFQGAKAKCTTIYVQPTDCVIITSDP